jgi:protein-disulfide isomerase
MFGVFLRYEPSNAGESHQSCIRNGIDEPVSQLWIDPAIFISPHDQRWRVDLSVFILVEITAMHGARESEQMVRSILAHERSEIARNELHRHVLGVGDAALEHTFEERRGTHDSARETERKPRGASLHLGDVFCRQLVEGGRIDQHEFFNSLRPVGGELHRNIAAEIDANDHRARHSENGHRGVDVFGLRGNAEIGVDWAVRLAVPEQVNRVRSVSSSGDRRRDGSPQKIAGPEAVKQNDGRTAVSVALDVNRARTNRCSEDISLHLYTPLLAFASHHTLQSEQTFRPGKMPPNDRPPRDRNVPRRNAVREARNASSRPKAFYWVLGAIALIGVAALSYVATKPKNTVRDANDVADTTNAGPSQGYLLGKPDAPVKILEFADFECPSCAGFSVVTEPDVRARIIDPGLANITYFDFPLTQHRNTLAASNAAACADEQGKFWPMHDRLFQAQTEWNGEATDVPKPFFKRYAQELGLDVAKWESCFDARKYQKRISANLAEGLRRGVNSTPSFVIGKKLYAGMRSYDDLKAIVDSVAKTASATASAGTSASSTAPK